MSQRQYGVQTRYKGSMWSQWGSAEVCVCVVLVSPEFSQASENRCHHPCTVVLIWLHWRVTTAENICVFCWEIQNDWGNGVADHTSLSFSTLSGHLHALWKKKHTVKSIYLMECWFDWEKNSVTENRWAAELNVMTCRLWSEGSTPDPAETSTAKGLTAVQKVCVVDYTELNCCHHAVRGLIFIPLGDP